MANGSGGALSNIDVLITIDTETLIDQGKMLTTGYDIIICDETTNTKYNYWVESCFNTTTTDIWFRVTSLPTGNNYFYLYYGSASASVPTSWQTYTGLAIYMFSGSTPTGFGSFTSLLGKYPRCAAWYSGSYTSGSATATHTHVINLNTNAAGGSHPGPSTAASPTHAHNYNFTSAVSSINLPPTLTLVFYTGSTEPNNRNKLTTDGYKIPVNTITYYSGSSAPSGWSQYTTLVNYIPSGSSANAVLSAGNHTHALSGTSDTVGTGGRGSVGDTTLSTTHTHTMSTGITGSGYPTSYTMYSISNSSAANIMANIILMATVLPPYGWRQCSEANLKFPLASGSYGTDITDHLHNVPSTATSVNSANINLDNQGGSAGTAAGINHTHAITGDTATATMPEPPYIDLIFIVREAVNTSLTITLGVEEGGGVTIPTRGYTPYTPTYASAFAFIETPRTATCNATEWEIRLNSGNRLSSYKVTVADKIGEFRNKVTKFDPIRLWVMDGPRFDLLMWGLIEDHDQIQQESTTFTLSGRNLGAYMSYRSAQFNWYNTDVMNIFISGQTAISGSVPELVWGSYITSPNKSLTVLGEKRKTLDVMTEIAQRVSDTSNTWINYSCFGEHADEERLPNVHFEKQQTIPSEVFLTPRDVIGYELLESSRSSIQKLQVEYAQSVVSGSTFWLVSGSDFTFSPAIATGSMRTGSCDNTVEARTEKGESFWLMRSLSDHLYIGSENRFWKLFIDISGSGIYTGSDAIVTTLWEYSKFGTGSTNTGSWGTFTVADETYGFNVGGSISFNVPVDWATGSFTTGSGGYPPYQYWVRVSTTGSYVAGSAFQILLASLYPCVWRSTGSEADAQKQYEYVYRGDILDSGSAITYADTILSQVYQPIKVQRIVMRGSTYWRPTYTYYWRGFDLSGSGRYRLASCIHRRNLEGYTTVLESARLA